MSRIQIIWISTLYELTWSWAVFTQTSSKICIAALSCAVTRAALSSSLSCSTARPSVLDAGWACRYWLKRALEPARYPIRTLTSRSNRGGHLNKKKQNKSSEDTSKKTLKFSLNNLKKDYPLEANREIKIHVHSKRQTTDLSGEFLRIENKQIKTVQNNSYG